MLVEARLRKGTVTGAQQHCDVVWDSNWRPQVEDLVAVQVLDRHGSWRQPRSVETRRAKFAATDAQEHPEVVMNLCW